MGFSLGPAKARPAIRFRYDVPLPVSHYVVKAPPKGGTTLGYHGTFDVDSQTGDVIRMTVIPTDLQQALPTGCDLRTRMTYTQSTLGGSQFMIPASTEREYLANDGAYSVNRMSYDGCQEYRSESVLSFVDNFSGTKNQVVEKASPVLPLDGSELRLRLVSKIDSE